MSYDGTVRRDSTKNGNGNAVDNAVDVPHLTLIWDTNRMVF